MLVSDPQLPETAINQKDQLNISQQEIQKCVDNKKELYNNLLNLLENAEDNQNDFNIFFDFIKEQHYEEDGDKYKYFH